MEVAAPNLAADLAAWAVHPASSAAGFPHCLLESTNFTSAAGLQRAIRSRGGVGGLSVLRAPQVRRLDLISQSDVVGGGDVKLKCSLATSSLQRDFCAQHVEEILQLAAADLCVAP